MRRTALALALSGLPSLAFAQLGAAYDAYVTKAMQDFKVPGLAIAVVRNDSVIFVKGYGTRTLGRTEPVDGNTLFAIGSVSKAFTATLVAMHVDEGKMRWDDPATNYLPSLELFDPYVSRELTVRDLLTHRSGLARGDLMWYATDLDRDEILRRVRFQRPTWSLRARYGYQNVMYLAAGQAAAKAAGKDWDSLVRERIFTPLGMTSTNTSTKALAGLPNVATPHQDIDDTLRVIAWHNIDNIGPAGSINSTVNDMTKWLRLQLAGGKWNGKALVSTGALAETHSPQTVIPLSADTKQINPFTHLASYGMGWVIQDYRGREIRQHGGNIDGMSALAALLPEEKLGVVVLTNANGSPMPSIAMYKAVDMLLKATPERDWAAEYMKARVKNLAMAKETSDKRLAARVQGTKPSLELSKYAGTYADSMYGEVVVTYPQATGNPQPTTRNLHLKYGTMFDGALEHWHFDTFRATWKERTMGKSFITFALDADGKVKNVEVEGLATFGRKPDAPDTTRRVVLAASDAAKLTGTYVSQVPALAVDVAFTDGRLTLTVPGQPVYTLLADSPTRFRLTGPPGMPAGFFVDFEVANGKVKQMTLTQPSPRPTLTFTPK
jgi:CubicO group peptidase (beta-lactamase class C family)